MKENQYNVPILLIAFNRANITQKVFAEIRKIKPRQLFMSVDGPRDTKPGEDKLCEATRDIIKRVDWDCEVHTLFHEKNLGCGKAVSGAITRFFEVVNEGVILEDDCLPHPSFFKYCEELLARYRNNERVMMISGDNFQDDTRGRASYYLSVYPHIWGWATWKRAWKYYDLKMESFPSFKKENTIKTIVPDQEEQKYWLDIFQTYFENRGKDTWDYQWLYTIWSKNALAITPNVNLVTNIGFDQNATHTKTLDKKITNMKTADISFPLIHPKNLEPDRMADHYTFYSFFVRNEGLKSKLKRFLKLK